MSDVMISLHCASMGPSAEKLKDLLEVHGITVWLCLEMAGGSNYRNEIVETVKTCKIFLPLINDRWAQSGECEDEYSLAKRQNLTSHESGRTKRTEKRLPLLLPVAFSDLSWNAYPHVELLAASTNFIVHKGLNFTEGPVEHTFNAIMLSIYNTGLTKIEIDKSLIVKKPVVNSVDGVKALKAGKMDVKSQMIDLLTSMQEITNSLQSITLSETFNNPNNQVSQQADQEDTVPELGVEYLGTSQGAGVMEDVNYTYWDSMRIQIRNFDKQAGTCKVTITCTELRKKIGSEDDDVDLDDIPDDHPVKQWANTLSFITYESDGVFNSQINMLSLIDISVTPEQDSLHKTYLVVYNDRLIGTRQVIEPMEENEDPWCVSPLNLQRVK